MLRLKRATVACHLLLIAALAACLLPPVTALRVAAAALLSLPLLLTLRGLARESPKSLQWLAVLLVAYVGGFCVEVVASSGRAPAANVALLAALLELGLTLVLIRRAAPIRPSARE